MKIEELFLVPPLDPLPPKKYKNIFFFIYSTTRRRKNILKLFFYSQARKCGLLQLYALASAQTELSWAGVGLRLTKKNHSQICFCKNRYFSKLRLLDTQIRSNIISNLYFSFIEIGTNFIAQILGPKYLWCCSSLTLTGLSALHLVTGNIYCRQCCNLTWASKGEVLGGTVPSNTSWGWVGVNLS